MWSLSSCALYLIRCKSEFATFFFFFHFINYKALWSIMYTTYTINVLVFLEGNLSFLFRQSGKLNYFEKYTRFILSDYCHHRIHYARYTNNLFFFLLFLFFSLNCLVTGIEYIHLMSVPSKIFAIWWISVFGAIDIDTHRISFLISFLFYLFDEKNLFLYMTRADHSFYDAMHDYKLFCSCVHFRL